MKSLMLALMICFLAVLACAEGEECTTALVGGKAAADGRPILWKNRDTDQLSNKVVFVKEVPFTYLAVVNAEDTSGRIAWGGLNERGFAIINSVSYNLPRRGGESEDYEGLIMATALRTCATVGDFEKFLKSNFGPNLGSRANFCVIDAQGESCIFEVHNHGFTRYNAEDTSESYLLNTNFSRSGPANQGMGYLRFDRETELFHRVQAGGLTHGFILQVAARDLGHPLERIPERAEWSKLPVDTPYWVHANHTINRASTACAIVIHGVKKGEDPGRATLWIILGEPMASAAVPLWVSAGAPPAELRDGADAPIYTEAARIRKLARPLAASERVEYLNLVRLDNLAGTGWLPANLALEKSIMEEAASLLSRQPRPSELARFQASAAARVLARLREIR